MMRNRHLGFDHLTVEREHLQRFLFAFLRGFVRRVALLPQEFGGSQKGRVTFSHLTMFAH